MLTIAPPKYRKHRPIKPVAQQVAPGPGALTLVSATYIDSTSVTLTFDRAISLAAFDPSAITVDDGIAGFRYVANGVTNVISPARVELFLDGLEELPFTGVHMTATNANGIVAAGDGAAWAGATDLELPYSS